VPNYIEPFFGSGAVLFLRPHEPHIETVNDKDCYVANFWRALRADPEGVAAWADWPVNEADLHARHWWLVSSPESAAFRARMHSDPDTYDVKIAGWWVWGLCQWIGAGWCVTPEKQQLPHLGNAGVGVHRPSQKLPHLSNAGVGVHRPSQKRPHLGDAGRGVHRPSQKRPLLGYAGRGDLYDYLIALADRLRSVRVCCGDWSRVLGESVTTKQGLTAVFLDPPYSVEAGRDNTLYGVEDLSVAHEVREWAIANGNNPLLRIALCGYESEHAMPESWECLKWKTPGGYSSRNTKRNDNSHKERIWFSPHCLGVNERHNWNYSRERDECRALRVRVDRSGGLVGRAAAK